MQICTERLLLRHPKPIDAQSYLAIHNSEFVLCYNAMEKMTLEQVEQMFSGTCENTLLLESAADGKILGAVFMQEDSLRYGVESVELSYFLDESATGCGYMREAMRGLISHLFTMGTKCVASRVFVPNKASHKLLASLGFHRDGVIPMCVKGYGGQIFDDTLYSVLAEQWK